VSKTDKTDPFFVHAKLTDRHNHTKGDCTLPPKPKTAAEYDAQMPWTSANRGHCYWEPRNWHDVKFPRPPKKWGHGAPDTRVLRQERLIVKEALDEILPPSHDEIIAALDEADHLAYMDFLAEPHFCRTCGNKYEHTGIDYCPEHREDD